MDFQARSSTQDETHLMIKVLLHWINNAELLQPKLSSKLTLTPSSGVPSTRTSWQSDNDAGTGEMLVQESCEEPGGVSIEPVGDTHVLWLCHGTSLVRCSPRQVRLLVEESVLPCVTLKS